MITVLIPLYNGIEYLEEAVESVRSQTFSEWEIIIGVNGHPPNSAIFQQVQSKYGSIDNIRIMDLYDLPEKGKSAALNEMVKHAIHKYIALLDADDIWHSTKLESQLPWIKEGYDVVGTQCMYFGKHGGSPSIPLGDISHVDFFLVNPIINSSIVIKKELCWWNGEYNGVEDYDLWLRLRKQNKRFYNCPDLLVKHRLHSGSAYNARGNGNLVPQLLSRHRQPRYRIRIFSGFCDSENCKSVYERLCQTDLMKNYGPDKEIYIVTDDSYTHVLLMNCPMPVLKEDIPKENVVGLAFEPPKFLGLSQPFIEYATKNIGKYFIGDSHDYPTPPFINKYAFMWHLTPPRREPVKNKLMSIMVSQKREAPGHIYRHDLVRAILATDLNIDIYGRGCPYYQACRDPRLKGNFDNDDAPHETYHFHICIENFQTEAYTSEKYTNTVLWGTTPIYLGCKNPLFPEYTITLSGDVEKDMELIKDILYNPKQYKRQIDQTGVRERLNLLKQLDTIFNGTQNCVCSKEY